MLGDIDTRMKTMWLKTRKWKPGDLEGKSVEFHITFSDATAEGLGEFIVRGNSVDLMDGARKLITSDHWSERGRAMSLANADALGRPRRSVLSLDLISHECL